LIALFASEGCINFVPSTLRRDDCHDQEMFWPRILCTLLFKIFTIKGMIEAFWLSVYFGKPTSTFPDKQYKTDS